MKEFLVCLSFATLTYAVFIPSAEDDGGFQPVAEKWHSSVEEYDEDSEQQYHEIEDYPKTVHLHKDYHHFEHQHEHHSPPTGINYHEHPKTVHIHEKPEVHVVHEPKTVHVHEHHHHHHHHVKTLPVSIIKKTVYIKHG